MPTLRFPAAEQLLSIGHPACAQSIGASRHLIQTTLQDEVFSRNAGQLEVMDGRRVSGLLWSGDHSMVLGGWQGQQGVHCSAAFLSGCAVAAMSALKLLHAEPWCLRLAAGCRPCLLLTSLLPVWPL